MRSVPGTTSEARVERDLTLLRGVRRVWLFMAHGMSLRGGIDNESTILAVADRLGKRLDETHAVRAPTFTTSAPPKAAARTCAGPGA